MGRINHRISVGCTSYENLAKMINQLIIQLPIVFM